MLGWKFRVQWAATGLTETVNALDFERAERVIKRKYRGAVLFSFVEATDPLPRDRWLDSLPRRVF